LYEDAASGGAVGSSNEPTEMQAGGLSMFMVMARNVPPLASVDQVSAFVSALGLGNAVQDIKMPFRIATRGQRFNKGYARIYFTSLNSGAAFIDAAHGSRELHPEGSRKLDVQWSEQTIKVLAEDRQAEDLAKQVLGRADRWR